MEEITAEFEAKALVDAPKLERILQLSIGCKTDLGRVRENNEDKFEYYVPDDHAALASKGCIFLVCDGMGGHAAGQIASELAAKTFIDVYLHHPSAEAPSGLAAAVKAANRFVLDVARAVPSRRGMGTTLSALILAQHGGYTVQVGDSRIYRLRDGVLSQLTHDHAWVDEAIRRGELPPEAADDHPYKHVLTRAVGTEDSVEPDIEEIDVKPGDVYLLCSDGLTNHVPDAAIEEVLAKNGPGEAAWKLVGKALYDGGSDNCTVLIVRVDGYKLIE